MQAIILAGGMGTRLRPLTYTLPKPMLPVAGRPALAHIVESLAAAGCEEVIITTNYLAELIEEKLNEMGLPIPVRCVKEDKPLGTAGCIKNLEAELADEFIVVQGDAVAEIDYSAFLRHHRAKEADVTISVIRVGDTREFGIVATDEDSRILRFQEKPRPEEAFSNLANAGFYILKKALFDRVPYGVPYDFARQLFPSLMKDGMRFYAWETQGYWVDIGRVSNYLEGNIHCISGKADVAPDVTIPETTTLLAPYVIGPGVKLGTRCTLGPGVIIGARCTIGDGAHVSNSVVYEDTTVGNRSRLSDCVIAARARIGSNVIVESLAVVGEGVDVGAGAQIAAHSRVGPLIPVAPGTVVEGVVTPRIEKLNGLQRMVVAGPIMEKLTPDEREVYALLAEFGEMTARDLAETGAIALFKVMSLLHSLEKQELVLSTQDVPKRYALTREEQHLPRRILFVDDLEDTREIFRLVFTMQGHSMRLAVDGLEAVEAVREERFDAIIMDAEMPNLSGWDATRLIRSMPNGRSVPVIMFTAYGDEDAQRKTREVGANGLLNKPILPEDMLPHVMRFIKK